MKPLLVILILVALVLGYVAFTAEEPAEPTSPNVVQETVAPYWEEPLPPGVQLLNRSERPRFDVVCERVHDLPQDTIRFHVTEEHGYMADLIRLEFWYRFYDEDSGEWIDTDTRVAHVSRSRLGFNETLTEDTVLLPIEYRNLGINLAETTSENWQAEVVEWSRAMKPSGG